MFRPLGIFRKRAAEDVVAAAAPRAMHSVEAAQGQGQGQVCSVHMQRVSELLGYLRPCFQRTIHEAHVERLMRDMEEDWRTRGELTVRQSVSVARLADGSHYILDGQHRLAGLSRLVPRLKPLGDMELPVVVYRCATSEEVLHWYARINHHLPIHPMELELAWADKVKPLLEHIQRRYRSYLSASAQPQCPNLHLPNVQTALQARAAELQESAITPESLVEDVEELQRAVRERLPQQLVRDPRLDKCLQKQPADPCFLGFWRHSEWIDLILHRRLRSLSWDQLDWGSFHSGGTTHPRKAIPKAIRREVWAKTNDAGSLHGACHICEEALDFDDMECAHDIPHCLGGSAAVDNLWPACRSCNRDMGIRRLEDYQRTLRHMRGAV